MLYTNKDLIVTFTLQLSLTMSLKSEDSVQNFKNLKGLAIEVVFTPQVLNIGVYLSLFWLDAPPLYSQTYLTRFGSLIHVKPLKNTVLNNSPIPLCKMDSLKSDIK